MEREVKLCINKDSREFVENLLKMDQEEFKKSGYMSNQTLYRTVYYLDDEIFINVKLIATENKCHLDISLCKDNIIGADILEREDSDNFETLSDIVTVYTLDDKVDIVYDGNKYIINLLEKEVIKMEKENGKVINLNKECDIVSFKTLTDEQKEAVYAKIGFGTTYIDPNLIKITTNNDKLITRIEFNKSDLPGDYSLPIQYDSIDIEYLDDTNLKFTSYNNQFEEKIIGYIEIAYLYTKAEQFGIPFYAGNTGRLVVKIKTKEIYKNDKLNSKETYQVINSLYQPPAPINIEYYLGDILVEKKFATDAPYMGFGLGITPKQLVIVYNNTDNTKGELLYSMEVSFNHPIDTKVFFGDDKDGKDLLKILQELANK